MDNVIHVDFESGARVTNPIKTKKKKKKTPVLKTSSHDNVSLIRDKAREDRRRKRRTIMSGLMNTAIVVQSKGLVRHNDVFLHDISKNGISFDLPQQYNIKGNERLDMRLYLNSVDFFEFTVLIKNRRPIREIEEFYRYGAEFYNLNESNKKAIMNLVKFIESASDILNKDRGEILFSKI